MHQPTQASSESSCIVTAENVTLTNCDREQVHIPGFIQPHGVLLGLTQPDLSIVLVSQNTEEILGLSSDDIMHSSLGDWVGQETVTAIQRCLDDADDFSGINPLTIRIQTSEEMPRNHSDFQGIFHLSDGLIILELEKTDTSCDTTFFKFYQLVKTTLTTFQKTQTLNDLYAEVVKDVRRLTGFDRVMIYRFNEDGSGTVVAEDKHEELEAYLGLCYPATDIPRPARRLYELNWVRLIPDVDYEPVILSHANNPLTETPLDLSHAVLRSVSSLHLEYLKNMGVRASMSISLLKQGKLWGLIACHHKSVKQLSYQVRTACEFLGQAMSLELVTKESNEDLQYKIYLRSVQARLVDELSASDDLIDSFRASDRLLMELTGASGVAICINGDWFQFGQTPDRAELENLLTWVEPRMENDSFCTHSLSREYALAGSYRAIASGLIVLSITRSQKNCMLWFRPEVAQSITWAGDPNQLAQVEADGSLYLTPRKSFERFQETVYGTSLSWKQCEIDGIYGLKQAIIGIVIRRMNALSELNLELKRSNDELDAFAYVASHDLKQPLRGINNYSRFLMEDYGDVLESDGKQNLEAIGKLTEQMDGLLDSLLQYSRLGHVELHQTALTLSELISDVLQLLKGNYADRSIKLSISEHLPILWVDPVQMSEIFTNLLSNAIKYNNHDVITIEVGCINPPTIPELSGHDVQEFVTLYVRDNGIGIPEKHHDSIFHIFRRLHKTKSYGGGTGIGLTIVKRLVERHQGKIWLESQPDQGTTFYFTLPTQSSQLSESA